MWQGGFRVAYNDLSSNEEVSKCEILLKQLEEKIQKIQKEVAKQKQECAEIERQTESMTNNTSKTKSMNVSKMKQFVQCEASLRQLEENFGTMQKEITEQKQECVKIKELKLITNIQSNVRRSRKLKEIKRLHENAMTAYYRSTPYNYDDGDFSDEYKKKLDEYNKKRNAKRVFKVA